MKIIVGLGNPEDKYMGTRHNLGFFVVDELRRKLNSPDWELNNKFKAEISKVNANLMLIRPQTYMNNSGMAVSKIANFYKVLPEDILVVHDELDLPMGHIKLRLGGGASGHHGVESVISGLGTDSFGRLRLGIGNTRSHSGEHKRVSFNAEHFVLEPFSSQEQSSIKKIAKKAIKAIEVYLKDGLEKAQNQFND